MTNNQLAENSITQLLNSVKLARDNAERDDNRVDHSFYYALTIALDELQERRKADSEPVATLDVQSRRPDGNKFALVFSSAAHKLPDDVYFLYRHAQPAPVVSEVSPLVSEQPAPVVPDQMLCDFYEVNNWPDLVRELVKHVEQLQDSAKRNVKPWEDTFPETLLPAYIERVKQTDEACRAAMLNGGKS